MQLRKSSFLFFSALVLAFAMACKPEFKPSTEPVTLTFSSDTVYLDTVFSSVGSSTRQMRIVNPSNQAVLINNLYLAGGESSPFRINVNGESGHHFADIQLAANDSIYVFVEVTAAANGMSFLYTQSGHPFGHPGIGCLFPLPQPAACYSAKSAKPRHPHSLQDHQWTDYLAH